MVATVVETMEQRKNQSAQPAKTRPRALERRSDGMSHYGLTTPVDTETESRERNDLDDLGDPGNGTSSRHGWDIPQRYPDRSHDWGDSGVDGAEERIRRSAAG